MLSDKLFDNKIYKIGFLIEVLIISEELIDGKSAHDQESHVHPGADMQEICVVLSYHLKLADDLGHMGHVMADTVYWISRTWAILYGLLSRSPIMKSYFLEMMSPATRMSGDRPLVLISSSRTGG